MVAPGWVDTPGERQAYKLPPGKAHPLDDPKTLEWIPLGRRMDAGDIANMVAFLCSDEAAAITGQIFSVDCGMTTRHG